MYICPSTNVALFIKSCLMCHLVHCRRAHASALASSAPVSSMYQLCVRSCLALQDTAKRNTAIELLVNKLYYL